MSGRMTKAALGEVEQDAASGTEVHSDAICALVFEVHRLRKIIAQTAQRIPYARAAMDDEGELILKEEKEQA